MSDRRAQSMQMRRARILDAAQRMIAESGFNAFNTRDLAEAAGVTRPTLYNLIGSKDEIVKTILLEAAERIAGIIQSIEYDDPLRSVDAFTDALVEVLTEDPTLYRAALIAVDRNVDLFADSEAQQQRGSIAVITLQVLHRICARQIEAGKLRGSLSADDLSATLYSSFKSNIRDWGHGIVSLETFARRVRGAFYTILAADAAPELRRRLLREHKILRAR